MTTWLVRKTGSDVNGGSSATVRSSGSDGIAAGVAGLNKISSLSAAGTWSAADIGQCLADQGGLQRPLITSFTAGTTFTATSSNGSANLTSSGQFTAAMVGQAISGPGIPAARCIQSVTDANNATMNGAAGVGAGSGTVTLGPMYGLSAVLQAGTGKSWVVGGAWQTVGAALSNVNFTSPVAAGESVYVGAGVYRETIVVAKAGSAGSPISVLGDVDGAVTGDPGEVQLTNYLVNDKTAPTATALLALGTNSYLSFSSMTLVSGASSAITNSTGGHDYTFTDVISVSHSGATQVNINGPTTGIPLNLLIDRCSFANFANAIVLTISLQTQTATGGQDANATIRNTHIYAPGNNAVSFTAGGANAFKTGGGRVLNCTIVGANTGVSTAVNLSTVVPCEVHNSIIFCAGATAIQANVLGQIIEDHNLIQASTPRTNTAVGPGSVVAPLYAPLLDIGQSYKVSGIARPYLSPASPTAPQLAFGQFMQNTGGPPGAFLGPVDGMPRTPEWRPPGLNIPAVQNALGGPVPLPTYDWANRPRPAGTQSNLPTVGYLEYHDSATKDTVTYDASPASAKLVGPGDIDLLIPVDAGSQTISIRCLYDTAYQGSLFPTLTLLANGEIGITAQTVVAGAAAYGTWQTITLAAINPTAAGILKVRLASRDAGGASQVNFDTFAIA